MNAVRRDLSPDKLCFLTTFFAGFATHLFGFVNVIHNYDDITSLPGGGGTGVTSGRWLLTILDGIFEKMGIFYNLPYVNAIAFLLLLALAAKWMVRILEIRDPASVMVLGAVFAAFPTATSTLFFKYTAVLYGIGIVCAVVSVWCVKTYRYGFLPGALLIACSVGIYQAYVPFAIGLMVLLLLKDTLSEEADAGKIVLRGLLYAGTLILGMALYYGLLQLCLRIYDVSLSAYQGINEMGALELGQLPGLLKRTLRDFLGMLFGNYHGVSQTPVVRLALWLLGILSAGMTAAVLVMQKKKWDCVVLAVLLCLVFPIAVNFIVIMCPNTGIYTLMVYPLVLVYAVPFVLLERIGAIPRKTALRKAVVSVTLVVFLSYAYWANVNYTQMHYANRKMENYISSMVAQVRMTEGFDPSMQWAFIGERIDDPMVDNNWTGVPLYGGNSTAPELINSYSRFAWIANYCGYRISVPDETQMARLRQDPAVKEMPCYPRSGSIRIVDDMIVIKLENIG